MPCPSVGPFRQLIKTRREEQLPNSLNDAAPPKLHLQFEGNAAVYFKTRDLQSGTLKEFSWDDLRKAAGKGGRRARQPSTIVAKRSSPTGERDSRRSKHVPTPFPRAYSPDGRSAFTGSIESARSQSRQQFQAPRQSRAKLGSLPPVSPEVEKGPGMSTAAEPAPAKSRVVAAARSFALAKGKMGKIPMRGHEEPVLAAAWPGRQLATMSAHKVCLSV